MTEEEEQLKSVGLDGLPVLFYSSSRMVADFETHKVTFAVSGRTTKEAQESFKFLLSQNLGGAEDVPQ